MSAGQTVAMGRAGSALFFSLWWVGSGRVGSVKSDPRPSLEPLVIRLRAADDNTERNMRKPRRQTVSYS